MNIEKLKPIGDRVCAIAVANGYEVKDWQPNNGALIFTNGAVQITVWLTKMTVGTCISHPKKGPTQMFRKKVSFELLETLFKNPRQHTGKGYYTKK